MFLQLDQYLCHLLAVHACQFRVSNAQYLISAVQALVLKSPTSTTVNKYIQHSPALKTQHLISVVYLVVYLCVCSLRPKTRSATENVEIEKCRNLCSGKNTQTWETNAIEKCGKYPKTHKPPKHLEARNAANWQNKSEMHPATGGTQRVH